MRIISLEKGCNPKGEITKKLHIKYEVKKQRGQKCSLFV
jgi:hypothetical protein